MIAHGLPLRRRFAPLGHVLAALALLVQMSVAWHAMPQVAAAEQFSALLAETICHADTADVAPGQTPAPSHGADCAICPVCTVAAQFQVLLAPPLFTLLAPLRAAVAIAYGHHDETGQPQVLRGTKARDPPVLI